MREDRETGRSAGKRKQGPNVIIDRLKKKRKRKPEKKMKCGRSEGVDEAEEREKETREKESGWERPSVAMETGSYQLTPCFPLVPPPTTRLPSLPLPVRSSFHHPHLFLPLFSFSRSVRHDHTPFHLSLPHPRLSLQHLSLFTSTTPLFLPTSPSHPSLASFPPTHSRISPFSPAPPPPILFFPGCSD